MKLKQLPQELKEESRRIAKTLRHAGRPFAPMNKPKKSPPLLELLISVRCMK